MRALPPDCVDELKVARGLLFLLEANLDAEACPVAYVSDASMQGYALLETDVTGQEVFELTAHRERNRFRAKE
eukprot:2030722-Heterocapsa_arctica.AAC.1